jgi:hypothetical protein
VLELDAVLERADVVPKVERTGRAIAGENRLDGRLQAERDLSV